jgi:hypothetical protein
LNTRRLSVLVYFGVEAFSNVAEPGNAAFTVRAAR